MHERYIARQPIFDLRMKLFGHELLFRDGPKNFILAPQACRQSMIVDSTMLYSLDALMGSAKAFIHLDLGAVMNGAALFLPPERTVIEILESVEPTAEVIAACQDLCDKGYTLTLDDFVTTPNGRR